MASLPIGQAAVPGGDPSRERLAGVDEPAAVAVAEGPVVTMVVAGLGLARERSEAALRLPAGVALAVSPYADDAAGWVGRAREAGHEALLLLPLEAADPALADAGPRALRPGQDGPALEAALAWVLGRGQGYAGLAGEAGAFARDGGAAFAPVAAALAGKGLALVELGGEHLATAARGLAYVPTGPAVDEVPSGEAVEVALGALEGRALKEGSAAGWARGLAPATLERIAAWAAGLEAKGVRLVPVARAAPVAP